MAYGASFNLSTVGLGEIGAGQNLLRRELIVILTVVFALVWTVPASGFIICSLCAVYALFGARQTVVSLTVLAFLLLVGARDISLARWIVVIAAFARMIWDTLVLDAPLPKVLWHVAVFAVSIFVFSLLVSTYPVVSLFKLLSFAVGIATILTAFHRTSYLREYWLSWFVTFSLFILIASIPTYFTEIGYLRNGVGFQGILSHPQTFGPVVAPMAALLTGMILFQGCRSKLVMIGAAAAWIGAYASQSRTALLAAVLGFGITVVVARMKPHTWWPLVRVQLTRPAVLGAMVVCCSLVAVKWSSIQEGALEFMAKDGERTSLVSALEESRGGLIETSMENFRSAPLTGIGFGVPSYTGYWHIETGAFGLPTGASVEKGFMPSAVLEETGITGAVLVLVLIFGLLAPLIKQGRVTLFWTCLVCILINLGEMVFFSIGGMGFYFWMLMGFLHTYADSAVRSNHFVTEE